VNKNQKEKNMKKIILIIALVIGAFSISNAQKFAYVDTDYILKNIPDYNDAQAEIDDLAAQWQKEIEKKFSEIDAAYKKYQADAVLLPEDMKRKREEEIIQMEKDAKNLQKKYFGQEGDLFKKRQELVKPIQEKVYNAIEEISTANNYGMVFDKAGSTTIMYVNARYDISDEVLDELGYSY
jgi:outer membrane protein